MSFNSPKLRGSRNVIRLAVLGVAILLISWLQMLKLPDPYGDDEPVPSRSAKQVQPTWTPPKETGRKINPGPFRLEIWRLEKVLYSLDAKPEDGWGVEVSLQSLADSLLDYKLDEDKTRAGIALRRFAVQVGSEMDAPYNRGPHWPEWRQQWESLRRRYFLPADWYAKIDPNGVLYSTPPGPVSPADRETVRRLNDLVGELQTHIRRGLQEAMEIPEPPGEVRRTTDEGRRMEQQWREWVQRWNRGVDSMARPYGDGATAAADPHIVLAGEQLRLAVSDLRLAKLVSPGLTYPSKQSRRQRFESAQTRVNTARDHLNRIGHPVEPVHD